MTEDNDKKLQRWQAVLGIAVILGTPLGWIGKGAYNNYVTTIEDLTKAHDEMARTVDLNAKYNQLILSSNETKLLLWDAQKKAGTFDPTDQSSYDTVKEAIKRQKLQQLCDTGMDLTACSAVNTSVYGGQGE